MALAGATLALAWCAPAASAQAQPEDAAVGGSIRTYADDDHMVVVSPSAGVQWPVGSWLLDARVAADVVSGASIDVVSEASPTAINERRGELSMGAAWQTSERLTLRGQLMTSSETDYDSVTVAAGGDVSFAQKNTTLAVLLRAGYDAVGHAKRPELSETRNALGATVTLGQVVDRNTYADAVVEVMRSAGYLESPYRTVILREPSTPVLMRVAEEVPDTRVGIALRGRVRRAFMGGRLSSHVDYRFYADDWSVESHTAALRVTTLAWRGSLVGASLRGYYQTRASFFRSDYELENGQAPALRTREKRLGAMASAMASITADIPLRPRHEKSPRIVVGVGGLRFWFRSFTPQATRNAFTTNAALSVPF